MMNAPGRLGVSFGGRRCPLPAPGLIGYDDDPPAGVWGGRALGSGDGTVEYRWQRQRSNRKSPKGSRA